MSRETQISVSAWCEVFPPLPDARQELHKRVVRLLEEAVELAVAAGINRERVLEVARICWDKSAGEFANVDRVPEEAADVLITLYTLATRHGFELHDLLDAKMAVNRSRPATYYQVKQLQKREQGL